MTKEIDRTSLNKFKALIDKNKEFLNKQKDVGGDDNKKSTLAVSMAVLEEYYKVSFKDAHESLVDKSGDCKIDAFFYNSEGDLSELVLIQSKYKQKYGDTGTFSEDDINLVLKNAMAIISGKDLSAPNERLKEKLNAYRDLLADNDSPPVKITVLFATNGLIYKSHKVLPIIENCEKKSIYCQFVDATEFGEDIKKEKGELKVNLKESEDKDKTDTIFKTEDDSLKGIIASCSIKDLLEFYAATGKRALLEGNVRFLLRKSNINKGIVESFKEEPDKFCFLNNGVYIMCAEYKLCQTAQSFMKIELENPTIINGGQTVALLYDLYEEGTFNEQFEKANIIVRICKYEDKELFLKIAKATNSQNKIDIVDLKANDEFQNIVKGFFRKKGVGLITKAGEEILYYDDTINNEYLLQLYAALYKNDPAQAKLSKKAVFKRFFDDVFSKKSLGENIFEKLYRCYEISNYLYSQRNADNKTFLEHAGYAIIYTMKCLDERICNPKIYENNLEEKLESHFKEADKILKKIVEGKRKELKDKFSLNNLFKSKEIKSLIDIKIEERE